MVRPEDFPKCCRCCLLTLGPMNSIFGTCLDTMLAQLTGLPVVKNDGYPEQMCSRCVIKLSSAYNFYCTVKTNRRALEEVLKAVTDKPKQLSTYQKNEVENKLVTQIDTTAASLNTVKNDQKPKASRQLSCIEQESQSEKLSDPEECYQCPQCNHNSQSEDDLKTHLQTHVPNTTNSEHLEAAKQLCSYCGKKFRLRTSLCKHLRLHRGDFFECKYCDKRFVEASTLKVHLVSHNLGNPKRFRCACGRAFAQRASLRRHARSHAARARLACQDCGKTFLHKFSLGKHRARAHAPAHCATCDQQFTGTIALNVHMKTHNINSLKTTGSTKTEAASTGYPLTEPVSVQAVTVEFLCLLCSGTYPNKESLEVHLCSRENVT